jgi:hypothetical protein
MIFRFLEPDCQLLKKRCSIHDLDFFSFYVPIKETELRLTELLRLEKERHGSLALNEHLMVVSIAMKINASLQRISSHMGEAAANSLAGFVTAEMAKLLRRGGWRGEIRNRPGANGFTGTEAVVRAPPNGYTLLLFGAAQVAAATLYWQAQSDT